jgi:hypothetical protein
MTATRPFGITPRRYLTGLETLCSVADSWVGIWAERLDLTNRPPRPSFDNVVPSSMGSYIEAAACRHSHCRFHH